MSFAVTDLPESVVAVARATANCCFCSNYAEKVDIIISNSLNVLGGIKNAKPVAYMNRLQSLTLEFTFLSLERNAN
jgi:hypothetical protein